jgi:hypothetical protein
MAGQYQGTPWWALQTQQASLDEARRAITRSRGCLAMVIDHERYPDNNMLDRYGRLVCSFLFNFLFCFSFLFSYCFAMHNSDLFVVSILFLFK